MKLNKDYVLQNVCGLQVAVSPQTSNIIKLSPSGAFIFGKLNKETTEGEILDALCAEYPDVAREQLATDLNEFLEQMRNANLLSE